MNQVNRIRELEKRHPVDKRGKLPKQEYISLSDFEPEMQEQVLNVLENIGAIHREENRE